MESPLNFADEIYQIFKTKKRLSLKCQELCDSFKKSTSRDLDMVDLQDLPFIQIPNNRNVVHLAVELDDCCNGCKYRYCKLLHTVDRREDKFPSNHRQSSRGNKRHRLSPIELPATRLIQRLKDILSESPTKCMSIRAMQQSHHRKWPQYKHHVPSPKSISIRFKSSFLIWNDDATKEQMITLKHEKSHGVSGNPPPKLRANAPRNGALRQTPSHSAKSNVIISSKKTTQSPWAKNKKSKATPIDSKRRPQPAHGQSNGSSAVPAPLSEAKPADTPQAAPPPHHPSHYGPSPAATAAAAATKSGKSSNYDSASTTTTGTEGDEAEQKAPPRMAPSGSFELEETTSSSSSLPLPEQTQNAYIAITISSEWTDSKLVPDLVRHISQLTGKHIGDAFIAHRVRLGFFTARSQSVAAAFVAKARERRLQCWGRTVSAELVPLPKNEDCRHGLGIQRQQSGHRVKVKNVNCIMGRKDFEEWVRENTKKHSRNTSVYDAEIVFPKVPRGATRCLMMVDNTDDAVYVVNRIQGIHFRGMPLKFEHWVHPNAPPESQGRGRELLHHRGRGKNNKMTAGRARQYGNAQQAAPIVLNRSKIRATSVGSRPQSGIWAKMADQRKQSLKRTEANALPTTATSAGSNAAAAGPPQTTSAQEAPPKHNVKTASPRTTAPRLYSQCAPSGAVGDGNAPDIGPPDPRPVSPHHSAFKTVAASNVGLADNLSIVSTQSPRANSIPPSQPTKPPKKSRDSTPPSAANNKPRVPPLINRFRSNSAKAVPLSPTAEVSTQTQSVQPRRAEEAQSQQPPPPLQPESAPPPESEGAYHEEPYSEPFSVHHVATEQTVAPNHEAVVVEQPGAPGPVAVAEDVAESGPTVQSVEGQPQPPPQEERPQNVSQQTQRQQQPLQIQTAMQQPAQFGQSAQQIHIPRAPQTPMTPQTPQQPPQSAQAVPVQMNAATIQMMLTQHHHHHTQQPLNHQVYLQPLSQNGVVPVLRIDQLQQLHSLQHQQPQQMLSALTPFQGQQFGVHQLTNLPMANVLYPNHLGLGQMANLYPMSNVSTIGPPPPPSSFKFGANGQSNGQSVGGVSAATTFSAPRPPPQPQSVQHQQPMAMSNAQSVSLQNNSSRHFGTPPRPQSVSAHPAPPQQHLPPQQQPPRPPQPQEMPPPQHPPHPQQQSQPQRVHQQQPPPPPPPPQQPQPQHPPLREARNRSVSAKAVCPPRKQQQQQRRSPKRPASRDPLDRLCKHCLLAVHDPSKCIWFNPNAMGKH